MSVVTFDSEVAVTLCSESGGRSYAYSDPVQVAIALKYKVYVTSVFYLYARAALDIRETGVLKCYLSAVT